MIPQKLSIKNRYGYRVDVSVFVHTQPAPLMFIVHGFGGRQDGVHLKRIAEVFYNKGYTIVTFDTTNSGGTSDTTPEGLSFTAQFQDLEDIVSWAKNQSWYAEPFALSGHSLGGMSVIYYAEQHPKQVNLLIPVMPVISGKTFEISRCKRDRYAFVTWEKDGYYERVSRSTGKVLRFPFSFVLDIRNYDTMALADKITARTVLIAGEKDASCWPETIQRLYDALKCPKEMITIADATHDIDEHPKVFAEFTRVLQGI